MKNSQKLIAASKHLRLVEHNGWSYVERINTSGVVCIVACTDEKKVLLIEQYRPPVGKYVIELPAGLAGDIEGQSDELFEVAAQRELIEETGYQASLFVHLAELASSAGLTNEVPFLYLASGLKKVSQGGGVDNENITIHEIPLIEIKHWLAQAQKSGKLVDGRVYAGLYFLEQQLAKTI